MSLWFCPKCKVTHAWTPGLVCNGCGGSLGFVTKVEPVICPSCARLRSDLAAVLKERDDLAEFRTKWQASSMQAQQERYQMLKRAEAAEEKLARAREALGQDSPWPIVDVLRRLAAATDHLLTVHGCDAHGHEEARECVSAARKIANALEALAPPPLRRTTVKAAR